MQHQLPDRTPAMRPALLINAGGGAMVCCRMGIAEIMAATAGHAR